MKITVRAVAKIDLLEVVEWYDNQRPPLGEDFSLYFKEFLTDIEDIPRMHAEVEHHFAGKEVREGLMRKYPYRITYEIEGEEIIIWSITHTKRGHAGWEGRLW